MHSRLLDWLDSQPTPRRRLYSALIALLVLTVPCYLTAVVLLVMTGSGDTASPQPPPDSTFATAGATEPPATPDGGAADEPTPTRPTSAPPTNPPTVAATPTIVERSGATPDLAPVIRTAPVLIPAEPTPTVADIILPLPTATDDVIWVTVPPPEASPTSPDPALAP